VTAGPPASLSIIIPVYNEEKRIEDAVSMVLAYCVKSNWDFEIILVEDGSTDATVDIIRRFEHSDGRVKLLSVPTHLGKGGSLKAAALFSATKKYMAYMDIDLSAAPSELSRLLAYIGDYDIVIGSRILRGDLPPVKRPFQRAVLSSAYSRFFRFLFRIPIYDPQCGFKLFRRDKVPEIFSEIGTDGFAFDTDLIVKAFSLNLRVKEVPINWNHGKASTLNVLREIRSMGSDILLIWYDYHIGWKEMRMVYPQKKGSIYGHFLFSLLSLSTHVRQKHLEYMKNKTVGLALLTNEPM
jgi:glycosyltransferase AglD